MLIIWGRNLSDFCLFDALACSANDIINDLSGHWLWADGPDSPALVQQSVKLLGSLSHCLLRVASCQVGHLWEVFLISIVQNIVVVVVSMGGKKNKTYQTKITYSSFRFHFNINMSEENLSKLYLMEAVILTMICQLAYPVSKVFYSPALFLRL